MKKSKPARIFLSLQPAGHRRPAGADPFTYRDPRPSRWRASWWTRGTTTELYRSKPAATEQEAVRLAHKWLERENKAGVRWIDTTDQPQRYGYEHAPAEKKSAAQLDAEIAEALAKKPVTRQIGIGLSAIDDDEWSWSVEQLREGQTTWGTGSNTIASGVEYSKGEAVAKIKDELGKLGVALADAVRLPF